MNAPSRRQRLAIVVLLVVSALFVTLDYRSGSFDSLRSGAATVFGPVQRGFSAAFGPVGQFLGGVPHVRGYRQQIDDLKRQNGDLRRQLHENSLDSDRSDELQHLKLVAGLGQYRVLPASTVSFGPSLGFEWTGTIDVGAKDGVKQGMTVINGDGLVGRIKQVGQTTSVVLLAVDPGSTVGVRQEASKNLALLTGNGLSPMSFDPLDPQSEVKVGDRLVTGPYGGSTYVPGVPVGVITKVDANRRNGTTTAQVRPYVKMSALDVVGVVLTAPREDPRDSVLPPKSKR